MSKYTTQVRFICEEAVGYPESRGLNGVPMILQYSAPEIFDFNFPIFDENYRLPLEIKILRHYYTREISEETVALWKLRLEDRLNMIMPYYNQLYLSELIEFNPLYDVDLTIDHKLNRDGFTHNNKQENTESGYTKTTDNVTEHELGSTETYTRNLSQNTGTDGSIDTWNLYSDTPQGGIEGLGGVIFDPDAQDPEELKYLTNATHNHEVSERDEQVSQTGNATTAKTGANVDTIDETVTKDDTRESLKEEWNVISNTDDYLEHVRGKKGGISYSQLIKEYRKNFLNIDKMVIDELSDLFFGLWE